MLAGKQPTSRGELTMTSHADAADAESRGRIDLSSARRLKDQLKVQREAETIASLDLHAKRRRLDEIAYYPKHNPRKDSPAYKHVHTKLVVELDLPCLICGVRNSTLNDPEQNPYGARQMETHHHVIEWALANAVDPQKFNSALRPNLQHRHPDTELYKRNMSASEIRDWVDHHEDNLWVLCDVHHRSKYFGIHEITHPIWGPVDLLKPRYRQFVREQLRAALAEEKGQHVRTRRPKFPWTAELNAERA
jgi:hypothetical protein